MSWGTVPFGKYKGRTFPEILVRDLDWFFWILPNLYGRLADEAEDLAQKGTSHQILRRRGQRLVVEYEYELGRMFCGFEFVDADDAPYSRWSTRLPCLDLSWPLRRRTYDERAGRIMIRDFRVHYFGRHKRLTKERCEEFFSNDANFIDV